MCPVVKRIWTPSFALWSGGLCFLFTGFLPRGARRPGVARWAFPLVVLGTNSIAAYCLYEAFMDPISQALVRHLGGVFFVLGPPFRASLVGAAALAVTWLILYWMYRRKLFLRI